MAIAEIELCLGRARKRTRQHASCSKNLTSIARKQCGTRRLSPLALAPTTMILDDGDDDFAALAELAYGAAHRKRMIKYCRPRAERALAARMQRIVCGRSKLPGWLTREVGYDACSFCWSPGIYPDLEDVFCD